MIPVYSVEINGTLRSVNTKLTRVLEETRDTIRIRSRKTTEFDAATNEEILARECHAGRIRGIVNRRPHSFVVLPKTIVRIRRWDCGV